MYTAGHKMMSVVRQVFAWCPAHATRQSFGHSSRISEHSLQRSAWCSRSMAPPVLLRCAANSLSASMRGAARSANRARLMTATRPDGPAAGWQRAGDTRPQYDQPPPRAPASQRFSHLRRWHSPPDLTSCFPPRCAELRFVNLNWPTSVVGVLEFVHPQLANGCTLVRCTCGRCLRR